ncbi:MAG: von Willebrand factor type A domain-containing protein [Candidatus Omnitrophota bacterium]|nr:von Willebrand factor type A domain-containing protein [Candidatus Omnitrophota bacterium]
MNDHIEWKILISATLDGEASAGETARAEAHLRDCAECRNYLAELKKISSSLKTWPNESLSPDLEHKIRSAIGKERANMERSTPLSLGVLSTILVAVLVVFTVQNYQQRSIQGRARDDSRYLSEKAAETAPSKPAALPAGPEREDQLADAEKAKMFEYKSGNKKETIADKVSNLTKAPMQGRLKSAADDISDQYSPGLMASRSMGTTRQYEPYYLETDYKTVKESSAVSAPAFRDATGRQELALRAGMSERKRSNEGFQKSDYDGGAYGKDRRISGLEERDENYPMKSVIYPYPRPVEPQPIIVQPRNAEEYEQIIENEFQSVYENALSTFSIDVDTASYSNVRRFIQNGQMPPADAVRVEEMINYFIYDYPQPRGNEPFSVSTEIGPCPWNRGHDLVLIGLQGKELAEREMPPSNLVFLIDVSGSMANSNKLPLLKSAFRLFVEQLRPQERIAIVTYSGSAGLALDSTPGYDKETILRAIDRLEAGGSTAGGEGIHLAYRIARENFIRNGNNRVILATDGDFNVGITTDSELVHLVSEKRDQGIFLTVLGFGTGNYKDSKMEKLADAGNGNYYYLDSMEEGRKVLGKELGSTLFTIAKDVKIQIEFNPRQVKAYRLIGYETRRLSREDFNNDRKDAGELGAGHTVTALYEVVPSGAYDEGYGDVDPLKYQKSTVTNSDDVMTVKLRYKEPDGDMSRLLVHTLQRGGWGRPSLSENFRFASAVAEFGLLLRNSRYQGEASYEDVIRRAGEALGKDPWGYRADFVDLVRRAAAMGNRPYHDDPGPRYRVIE